LAAGVAVCGDAGDTGFTGGGAGFAVVAGAGFWAVAATLAGFARGCEAACGITAPGFDAAFFLIFPFFTPLTDFLAKVFCRSTSSLEKSIRMSLLTRTITFPLACQTF
jgi:hypothetical protein